ncbi:unnamed protein product (macronuclear) [Paramecium tetraurelia]|uniref:Uncharacterized protein n=1 Tax=Paramecium tetraurelia TaxID=5888 RepID=A0DEQ8_PARTE|nr:uncharacterized protein GSPATT00016351001 [Paramecium tetraurelia]CAK81525.1 unnamed protein product [Paramecium tetraurelia]|eukprot:XP_001448922.1 hypothetical protein (macronuclear) [Paramecium tetraurelia strain d4-2]
MILQEHHNYRYKCTHLIDQRQTPIGCYIDQEILTFLCGECYEIEITKQNSIAKIFLISEYIQASLNMYMDKINQYDDLLQEIQKSSEILKSCKKDNNQIQQGFKTNKEQLEFCLGKIQAKTSIEDSDYTLLSGINGENMNNKICQQFNHNLKGMLESIAKQIEYMLKSVAKYTSSDRLIENMQSVSSRENIERILSSSLDRCQEYNKLKLNQQHFNNFINIFEQTNGQQQDMESDIVDFEKMDKCQEEIVQNEKVPYQKNQEPDIVDFEEMDKQIQKNEKDFQQEQQNIEESDQSNDNNESVAQNSLEKQMEIFKSYQICDNNVAQKSSDFIVQLNSYQY